MPTLKDFERETGIKARRWKDAFKQVRQGMSKQDEEIARFTADTEARYKGPCPPDLYPVTVTDVKPTWVNTSQPERPPDDSFNFVQEHDVQIEWVWEDAGDLYGDESHKYNGPEFGVPFIDQCPFDPFIGDVRARARWGMQDAHPENRGFVVGAGPTYYGAWSEWSDWYTFPVPVEPEPEPEIDQEFATWLKEARAAIYAMTADKVALQAGIRHERYILIERGELYADEVDRANIKQVIDAWQ